VKRRSLLKAICLATSLKASSLTLGSGASPVARSRLRTAICAYSFREALQAKTLTYDDLVRLAVELEVDGLDLTVYWFPNTLDTFLLPLRRFAYKNGVEIYSISVRTDMCRSTAEAQAREVAGIQRWVDVAAKLGAGHIRVFGGNVPKESTEDQAAQTVVSILKRAADYSGRKGIILGLENHGGITEKAARVIQIVKQVNSPWVGINLDTGNFSQNSYPQIEACVPYAVNIQFKTEIEEAGKKSPSDWNRIMEILAKGGYKGYLALEYEAEENPSTAVPRLTRELNRMAHAYSRPS
jgi:L-ribulose-5-phosphate 3-epimerase